MRDVRQVVVHTWNSDITEYREEKMLDEGDVYS